MTLVICEKNRAARRISGILSGYNTKTRKHKGVAIYTFKMGDEEWEVLGLRGHIVELDYPKELNKWQLETLEKLVEVDPIKNIRSWNIVSAIKERAKEHDEVIIATDYDREGELIGVEALEIVQEANPDIKFQRAKFSTLTKDEIDPSFSKLIDVDYNLSSAAETRQVIDLTWGAVLTRFLSITTKRPRNSILSAGRVQTPSLAIIVDRERERESFKPQDFWNIIAFLFKEEEFQANHEKDRIFDEEEAKAIFERVKPAEEGKVKDISVNERNERPPSPFDTTAFLAEASKYLNIRPNKALQAAESLYIQGFISYPRTDNTVYPRSTPLRKILERLKSMYPKEYKIVEARGSVSPTRGKKESKDHPPIHPLYAPEKGKVSTEEWKVFDLIARRFLATIGPYAKVRYTDLIVDIKGENFLTKGIHTLEPGWRTIYPFINFKETSLPALEKGDILEIKNLKMKKDKTKPPARYSHHALLREMEKLNLGTKSTRADIINKILTRGYARGRSLVPTESGRAVICSLEDHAEPITRPDMTSRLEKDMEQIKEGKTTKDEVVCESHEMLEDIITALKENREEIAEEINKALEREGKFGVCPDCGSNLVMRKSRRGKRFIGCSGYPKCTRSYPLPQKGAVYPTERKCKCDAPLVRLYVRGKKRSTLICPNPECERNQRYWKRRKEREKKNKEKKD